MRLPPTGSVSGWASLRLWGGGFFDGTTNGRTELPVDLVVPAAADIRRAAGIVRHRGDVPDGERATRHGISCTIATRALFDAIRWEADSERRQQIADLALSANLTPRSDFEDYVRMQEGVRGRRIAQVAMRRASDRVLSPMETTLRLLWEQHAELPPVLCNWPVADHRGHFIGRPDLLCDEEAVVIEFDGRDHTRDDVRVVDMRKEDGYRRCGLEYIRVIGRDLPHRDRILTRMREAVHRSRTSGRPRTYRLAKRPPPVLAERNARTGCQASDLF